MQNNKVIAITGGIGSGKSTCLQIIEKLGYKSISADLVYQDLLLDESFVQTICDDVKRDVDSFVGDALQFDDITMLCLKYNGQEKNT